MRSLYGVVYFAAGLVLVVETEIANVDGHVYVCMWVAEKVGHFVGEVYDGLRSLYIDVQRTTPSLI